MENTATALVEVYRKEAITTSVKVADYFGKRHDHVIRDIEDIIAKHGGIPKIGGTPFYRKSTYTHPQNKQTYPMYIMNFNGFSLLAFGFTGKKALDFKIDYIAAFNAMKAKLEEVARNHADPNWWFVREDTKISFMELARVIKSELIPYAQEDGSENYRYMYSNYAKLIRKLSGVGKRDWASTEELAIVNQLQAATIASIRQGIRIRLNHNAIYSTTKDFLVDMLSVNPAPRIKG